MSFRELFLKAQQQKREQQLKAESANTRVKLHFTCTSGATFKPRFLEYDPVNELLALCSAEGKVRVIRDFAARRFTTCCHPIVRRSEALLFSAPDSEETQGIFFYGTRGNFVLVYERSLRFFHLCEGKAGTVIHFGTRITAYNHQKATDYVLVGLSSGTTHVVCLSKEVTSSFVIHPQVLVSALATHPRLDDYSVTYISTCPCTPTHNLISLTPRAGSAYQRCFGARAANACGMEDKLAALCASPYAAYHSESCYSPLPPRLPAASERGGAAGQDVPLHDLLICCDVGSHRCRDFQIAPFGRVCSVAWRPDAQMFCAGHEHGLVTVWNLFDTRFPQAVFVTSHTPEHARPVVSLSWFKMNHVSTLTVTGGNVTTQPSAIVAIRGNIDTPAAGYSANKSPPRPYYLNLDLDESALPHKAHTCVHTPEFAAAATGCSGTSLHRCADPDATLLTAYDERELAEPHWTDCGTESEDNAGMPFKFQKAAYYKTTTGNELKGVAAEVMVYDKTFYAKQKNPNSLLVLNAGGELALVGLKKKPSLLPFSCVTGRSTLRFAVGTFFPALCGRNEPEDAGASGKCSAMQMDGTGCDVLFTVDERGLLQVHEVTRDSLSQLLFFPLRVSHLPKSTSNDTNTDKNTDYSTTTTNNNNNNGDDVTENNSNNSSIKVNTMQSQISDNAVLSNTSHGFANFLCQELQRQYAHLAPVDKERHHTQKLAPLPHNAQHPVVECVCEHASNESSSSPSPSPSPTESEEEDDFQKTSPCHGLANTAMEAESWNAHGHEAGVFGSPCSLHLAPPSPLSTFSAGDGASEGIAEDTAEAILIEGPVPAAAVYAGLNSPRSISIVPFTPRPSEEGVRDLCSCSLTDDGRSGRRVAALIHHRELEERAMRLGGGCGGVVLPAAARPPVSSASPAAPTAETVCAADAGGAGSVEDADYAATVRDWLAASSALPPQRYFVEFLPHKSVVVVVSESGYGEQLQVGVGGACACPRVFGQRYALEHPTAPTFLPLSPPSAARPHVPGLRCLSVLACAARVTCTRSHPASFKSWVAVGFEGGTVAAFTAGADEPELVVSLGARGTGARVTALDFVCLLDLTLLFVGLSSGDVWCVDVCHGASCPLVACAGEVRGLFFVNRDGTALDKSTERQPQDGFFDSVCLAVTSTEALSCYSLCLRHGRATPSLGESQAFARPLPPRGAEERLEVVPERCAATAQSESEGGAEGERGAEAKAEPDAPNATTVLCATLVSTVGARDLLAQLAPQRTCCRTEFAASYRVVDPQHGDAYVALVDAQTDVVLARVAGVLGDARAPADAARDFTLVDVVAGARAALRLSPVTPATLVGVDIASDGRGFVELSVGASPCILGFSLFGERQHAPTATPAPSAPPESPEPFSVLSALKLSPAPAPTPMKTFSSRFDILEFKTLETVYMLPDSAESIEHDDGESRLCGGAASCSITQHLVPTSSKYNDLVRQNKQ